MKSFASIALMACAAVAVQTEDAYSSVFHKDPYAHKHHYPVVHVDVWETISADLDELMTEVTDLQASTTTQGETINQASLMFQELMGKITTLKSSNSANSISLAQQKAIDASQNAKLEQLVDDVTAIEHKVATLTNKTTILQRIVDDLPDFDSLLQRIIDINDKNTQLMMDAGTNMTDLTTITTAISTANGQVMNASSLITTAAGEIDTVNTKVTATTDVITQNGLDITALETLVDMQQIVADHFESNAAEIELNIPETPVATFCVPDGETVEFHLSLADEAGLQMDGMTLSTANTVERVNLVSDVNGIVAQSNQVDSVRGHQHSLFYKVTNATGDNETFTVNVDAIVSQGAPTGTDTFAKINANNLQWGYRTYAAGYTLEAMPNDTC